MGSNQIIQALEKIKPGLRKYINIMDKLHRVDVSTDKEFQKMFNGFYRIRQRNDQFYCKYYAYLETNKSAAPTFEKTLEYFYNELGRIEASFSSKLIATIDPNLPIWDSVVLANLNLRKPQTYCKNRVSETIKVYYKIVDWYDKFLRSDQGLLIVDLFDKYYPGVSIMKTKKIDFVLWQTRE